MNKIQIQLVQINNGWLLNTPPTQEKIMDMQQAGIQPQPDMTFCEGYEEVCMHLKSVWPKV